jgi:peptidoglycan/LPS O-acetylase OafA/YrhL
LLSIGLFILYKKGKLKSKYAVPLSVFIIAVCCLLLRYYTWGIYNGIDDYLLFFATHVRIDSLAFGVLIAWLYHFHSNRLIKVVKKIRLVIMLVIPLLLLPAFMYDADTKIMVTTGFTYLYVGFGLLLVLMIVYTNEIASFLAKTHLTSIFSGIAWVGLYSYPIYLIHMKAGPILSNYIVRNYSSLSLELVTLLNFAFNILCGYILSLLIERPFLRLREKYYPAVP